MRNRNFIVITLVIVFSLNMAQRPPKEQPKSTTLPTKVGIIVPVKVLPAIDARRLSAQEGERRAKDRRNPGPLRFAVSAKAGFDLKNAGTWQTLPDGRLWRLQIRSPGAMSNNIGFTRFELPEGAKLWLYDPSQRRVQGPFTARDRSHAGTFWSPIIPGEEIVVELFVPNGAKEPVLQIGSVNQGFRQIMEKSNLKDGIAGDNGACNNDVICPEGAPYADPSIDHDPIHAVAVYTRSGVSVCTGTLLNDVPNGEPPYFLTAYHCGVDSTNDDTVVTYWNFFSPVCADQGPDDWTDEPQFGAIFRSRWQPTDFMLMELEENPRTDLGYTVRFNGWDATGIAPASTVAIHHPRGDVKSITFSNSAPASSGDFWNPHWDDGVTEPGSSGSCLFDASSTYCIGQLQGGPSFCGASDAEMNDFYGKFSVSWTGGGTDDTRLSNWLDPGNTGVLTNHGDPHLTTANNIKYDFQGGGEYVALRTPDMEIQTRMTPVATTFNPGPDPHSGLATCVSLNSAVAARVGQRRVTIQPNLSGVPDPSGLQVRIDGTLTSVGAAGVPVGGGRIRKTATGYDVNFPNGTTLTVTPNFWNSQGKWYMNIDIFRSGSVSSGSDGSGGSSAGGIMAATAKGSWLPALPDGSSLGPRPASLNQRYDDLYLKFGNAWRVTSNSSLFDYTPGTSTNTFTFASWPSRQMPCTIPEATPAQPVARTVAARACRGITDKAMNANCVFDVQITGELGFAKLYETSQRLRAGATVTTLDATRPPTRANEAAVFTATVAARTRRKGTPTGSVLFAIDGERAGETKLNSRGEASFTTSKIGNGTHVVTAEFVPPAGSVLLGSSTDRTYTIGARDTVVIRDLPMQAGTDQTPCPPLGVAYSRDAIANVPLLQYAVKNFDATCAASNAGELLSVAVLKCEKDPRGQGFGPNATVNLTCARK